MGNSASFEETESHGGAAAADGAGSNTMEQRRRLATGDDDDNVLFSQSFSSAEAAASSPARRQRPQRQRQRKQQQSSSRPTRTTISKVILPDNRASPSFLYRQEEDDEEVEEGEHEGGVGGYEDRLDHEDDYCQEDDEYDAYYASSSNHQQGLDGHHEADYDHVVDHRDEHYARGERAKGGDHHYNHYNDWKLTRGTHDDDDDDKEEELDIIMLEHVMKRQLRIPHHHQQQSSSSSFSSFFLQPNVNDDFNDQPSSSSALMSDYAQCSASGCSVPRTRHHHNNNNAADFHGNHNHRDRREDDPLFLNSCGVVAGSVIDAVDENKDFFLNGASRSRGSIARQIRMESSLRSLDKNYNDNDNNNGHHDDDPAEYGSQSRPILLVEDGGDDVHAPTTTHNRQYSSPSSSSSQQEEQQQPSSHGAVTEEEKQTVSILPPMMIIPQDVFPAAASESFHLLSQNNHKNDDTTTTAIATESNSALPDCTIDHKNDTTTTTTATATQSNSVLPDCTIDENGACYSKTSIASPVMNNAPPSSSWCVVPTPMIANHDSAVADAQAPVSANHAGAEAGAQPLPSWCTTPTPVMANHASDLTPRPSWCTSPTTNHPVITHYADADAATSSPVSTPSSASSLEQGMHPPPPRPPPPPPGPMMTSQKSTCTNTRQQNQHGPPPAPDAVVLHTTNRQKNHKRNSWPSRNIKKFNKQRQPPTPDDPFLLLLNHENTTTTTNRRRHRRGSCRPDDDPSTNNKVKMVSSSTAAAAAAFEKILSAMSEKSTLPPMMTAASTASTTCSTVGDGQGSISGNSFRNDVPSSSIMANSSKTTPPAPADLHIMQLDMLTAPEMMSNVILGEQGGYFGKHQAQQPVMVGLVMHQHHHHHHHGNNNINKVGLATNTSAVNPGTTTANPGTTPVNPVVTKEQQDQRQHLDGDDMRPQQCKTESVTNHNGNSHDSSIEQPNLLIPNNKGDNCNGEMETSSVQWQNTGNHPTDIPNNQSEDSTNRMFSFAHVESEDEADKELVHVVVKEANCEQRKEQPTLVENRIDNGDPQGTYIPSTNDRQQVEALNHSIHRPQRRLPSPLPPANYSKEKDKCEQGKPVQQTTYEQEEEPELNPNRRDGRSIASGSTIQASNLDDQQLSITASVEEADEMVNDDIDIDMSFVDQYESFFNAFLWQSADLLVRNPDFIATLRVAKLQKLLQVNMDREASLERELEQLKRKKQEMVQYYQAKLIEATRFKAAREIHLQQELTTIEQATLVMEGRLTWEIITKCNERAKQQHQLVQDLLQQEQQQQQAVDPDSDQDEALQQRNFFLSILPNVPETQQVREAMTAPNRNDDTSSRPLSQQEECDLRQLQVDNAFLKSEVQVLEKKLAYKKVATKKHSWVDSVFLRLDDKRMQRLKGRYQKKLGVTF